MTCGQAVNTVCNHFLEKRCQSTDKIRSFDS